MFKEFKDFAMRGNVVDMAVGVIIGGAFGKIIASLVNDILMPPLGLVIGNMDFSELKVALSSPIGDGKPVAIQYGLFINNIVNFVIVAVSIFLFVKLIGSLHKKEAAPAAPPTKACPDCLSQIPLKARRCAFCTSPVGA